MDAPDIHSFSLKNSLFANRQVLLVIAFWGISANLCTYSITFIIQSLIDKAIPQEAIESIVVLSTCLVLVALLEAYSTFQRTKHASRLGSIVVLRLRESFNTQILQDRATACGHIKVASYLDISRNLDAVRSVISHTVPSLGMDCIAAIAFIALFVFIIPPLGGIAILGILLQTLLPFLFGHRTRKHQWKRLTLAKEAAAQVGDTWTLARTVHGSGKADKFLRKIGKLNVAAEVSFFTAERLKSQAGGWSLLTGRFTSAMVYAVGALLLIDADITFGQLIGFSFALGRATAPLSRLSNIIADIYHAKAAMRSAAEVLQESTTYIQVSGEVRKSATTINVENLRVPAPNSDKCLLEDICFNLTSGQILAVVGNSGSGKTTLLRTVLGELPNRGGSITVNGESIALVPAGDRHRQYHLLSSRPDIFNGTVLENIILDKPSNADEEALERALACTTASENDFWNRINLNRLASNLSNGQQQRVAIARSLYHNVNCLVLDEATNGLDTAAEEAILSNIKILYPNTAVIIVSHRKNIMGFADTVLHLEMCNEKR